MFDTSLHDEEGSSSAYWKNEWYPPMRIAKCEAARGLVNIGHLALGYSKWDPEPATLHPGALSEISDFRHTCQICMLTSCLGD